MKILYIHGYNGNPYGSSYHHLKNAIDNKHELFSIDYNVEKPAEAIVSIYDYIIDNNIDFVIGSSLGGFLTLFLPGVPRMVINPCWNPVEELPKIGYDGPQHDYQYLLEFFKEFHDYEEYHLCAGCFSNNDELLGTKYKEVFSKYFENVYDISDGHHITDKSANEIITYFTHHIKTVNEFCEQLEAMDNSPQYED